MYKSIDLSLIMVSARLGVPYVINDTTSSGRAVGQEWRLYDVGGTRSSVRTFLLDHLPRSPTQISPFNLFSVLHGIRILMMVSQKTCTNVVQETHLSLSGCHHIFSVSVACSSLTLVTDSESSQTEYVYKYGPSENTQLICAILTWFSISI